MIPSPIVLVFLLLLPGLCSGLPQLSVPVIGLDNLIYACAENDVVAFNRNGALVLRASMNQTCRTDISPVLDSQGNVYVAGDQTISVVTPSNSGKPSVSDFFSKIPDSSLESLRNISTIQGVAVSAWSSAIYINTMTGIYVFMLDGTPVWSSLVDFQGSTLDFPDDMKLCADKTNCGFLSSMAVDECDGSVYVVRSDGWLYSYATWQPHMRWRYALSISSPSSVVNIVSGNNGRVYAAVMEHSAIYALSTDLGNLVWKAKVGPLGERSCSLTVDLSGYVSVGSLDGFLYVISPDGVNIKRYLANDVFSPLSIQSSPLLDCSSESIYVAQSRVKSKTIMQTDDSEVVSFTQLLGVNIWMVLPSSGQVLWSTVYPDLFPAEMLLGGLSSFKINSDWLIALTASANLSSKSYCKTQDQRNSISCSKAVFNITYVENTGNMQIIALCIVIIVVFALLIMLSIILYRYWRRKRILHHERLRMLYKQEILLHPQAVLLRRQRVYLQTIELLRIKLEFEPDSAETLEELKAALTGLEIVKRYLALLPSIDANSAGGMNKRISNSMLTRRIKSPHRIKVLLNSVMRSFMGRRQEEDFEEEMCLLRSYSDDVHRGWNKEKDSHFQQGSMKFDGSGNTGPNMHLFKSETPAGDKHEVDSNSSEYSNPLYKWVPQSESRRRPVTFSPVDENREEIEVMSNSDDGRSNLGAR